MSLGLNDLKKKRPAKKSAETYPTGAWSGRTTRPWSGSELAGNPSPARRIVSDAVMNQEWLHLVSTSILKIDFAPNARLMILHDRLVSLEERINLALLRTQTTLRSLGLPV